MPAAASLDPAQPRVPGWLHEWAAVVSLVAGVALVLEARSAHARLARWMYTLGVAALGADSPKRDDAVGVDC